jgi:hypothetical protein
MDTITKAKAGLKELGQYGERPMETKFGGDSKSHHILYVPQGQFMRSYSTIIAFIDNDGNVVLNNE